MDVFSRIPNALIRDRSSKLISVKSRRGLTQPPHEITEFSLVLEIVFRNLHICTEVSVPFPQK